MHEREKSRFGSDLIKDGVRTTRRTRLGTGEIATPEGRNHPSSGHGGGCQRVRRYAVSMFFPPSAPRYITGGLVPF